MVATRGVEGHVPLLTGRTLRRAGLAPHGRVRLTFTAHGEEELDADHVIAATGYRIDLARLPFLGEELRARVQTVGGAPKLSSSFESSVPGLHFVGLAAAHTFGPAMRFVYGTRFSSTALVRGLARHGSERTLEPAGGYISAEPCAEVDQAPEMVRQR